MMEQEERDLLYTKALMRGVARWEPFSNQSIKGEICINGIRYSVKIDEDTNMPIIDNYIYSVLKENMKEIK